MNKISNTTRLAFGLALLSLSAVMGAHFLNLFPDELALKLKHRVSSCESLALNCSLMARRHDAAGVERSVRIFAAQNADVLSVAFHRADGQPGVVIGDHAQSWRIGAESRSTSTNIAVPITSGREPWGTIEVAFHSLAPRGWLAFLQDPFFQFTTFVTGCNLLAFLYCLRRTLTHLDPSKVVPGRVRAAFDTLAEGVLVLDDKGRIVLANQAFSNTLGTGIEQLQGKLATSLPWADRPADKSAPWEQSMTDKEPCVGVSMSLPDSHGTVRTFTVNTTPILGEDGRGRGVLASFDDVTALESKKAELLEMLDVLKESRDQIKIQNEQLTILATRDPLTSCLNRRSLFEEFHRNWEMSQRYGHPLCAAMVDIDHFKSVNDTFGHGMGDEVLKTVAETLQSAVRANDSVGRFGGEEFCVLMPHADIDQAFLIAERFRQLIAALEFPNLKVTASFGVSSIKLGAPSPQDLLEQADKCLYVAKRNGRNQVVRFDEVPKDLVVDSSKVARSKPTVVDAPEPVVEPVSDSAIPFQAVTALLSALAYRDSDTASHSLRVAELCAEAARGLMSVKDGYVLEVAGMLHDIGKIGVPDAILLKPGKLTAEEWDVMRIHDRIGVEIIHSAFACQPLVEIVRYHHAPFGGDPSLPGQPIAKALPLGSRILTIADAFDAMVSDRVYRKAIPVDAAFAELRRCAGRQFDPELVEHFITMIGARHACHDVVRSASKDTALQIGLQIERLAEAIDKQDIFSLAALASRIESMGAKQEVAEIQEVAGRLRKQALHEPDLKQLAETTCELIDLCRSTQKAYVDLDRDLLAATAMRRKISS